MSKKRLKRWISGIFLLAAILFSAGCAMQITGQGKTAAESITDREKNISPCITYESSLNLEYAKNFAVDYYRDGYKMISILGGDRFLLIPKDKETPEDLPGDVIILKQPVSNIYLVATAVMDMFRELDALDFIRFSGQKAEGWYIDEAKEAMEAGEILYAGKYSMPDYELILSEGCALAIENRMISHVPEVREKLKEFGIPVMVDCSSYEEHPLGRTEWIKLYGALLGKEEEAESAFRIQTESLKRVSEGEKTGKTIAFFYITANGAVNVRKSSDYIPKMIELAGGKYIFGHLGTEEDKKSSITMQMEEFYKTAKEADYLIYNSTIDGEIKTVEELLGKSEMLESFQAVADGNVFCTTNDLYQQSMSAGQFIEDIHAMLTGDADRKNAMKYLYPLR